MATGKRIKLTQLTGEYYVSAELARRGYYPALLVEGWPGIDIMVEAPDERLLGVQVKTKGENSRAWQTSSRKGHHREEISEETTFWVFVELVKDGGVNYWVCPGWWIENDIYETYTAYLERLGVTQEERGSTHHSIRKSRLEGWEERWDLLEGPS